MSTDKVREQTTVVATEKIESSSTAESQQSIEDYDAQRLRDLGYKQEFTREISLFVQSGFAFSTMAVLPNWLVNFGSSMAAGGPMSLFWGIIVVAPFVFCIALSMSEVFSSYPVNGGVYSWCYLLSSKERGPLMSWICGYTFVAGLLATCMTVAYSMGEYILSIANVLRETPVTNQGAYVGLYILLIILGVIYCSLGLRLSAWLNKFMIYWVTIGTIIVVIAVPVMAQTHPDANWVFTKFENQTGYSNDGLAFLLGLLQAGWSFIGFENGAQIAEGTKNADRTGPRGILIAVSSAVFQAIVLCISTLFSIQDVQEIQASSMPVATLFLRATRNPSLTAFFLVILAVIQFGSLCNSMVACAQTLWAMARDECVPAHHIWYKLHSKSQMPVRILTLQGIICIIIIMPSFGSEVYWSAIMSTAVICVNVAYGLPFLCRLLWKRKEMEKGPFNLGRYSVPINFIAVAWIAFFSVILCIPSVHPVTAVTMNWSCLMIGFVMLFSLGFWYIKGRHDYQGPIQTIKG